MKIIKTTEVFALMGVIVLVMSGFCGAEDFQGAPVPSGGKVALNSRDRMEVYSALSHDEVVAFYRDAFRENKDIRFRNWMDATYIEDDGSLRWHSITISKNRTEQGTHILMVKDNWKWILGTLTIRFIGVFVVLLVLYVALAAAARLITQYARVEAPKKTAS